MSGNQAGGGGIGAVAGGVLGGVIGSVVPVVGTVAGAGYGAAIGGAIGGSVGGSQDAARAQAKVARSLIKPIDKVPVMPTINNNAVQKAKMDSLFSLQNRSGRASTFLTSTANTDKFGG